MKNVRNRSFSGPYFPALNTNSVSPHIQSKFGKLWTRKTPGTETFYVVITLHLLVISERKSSCVRENSS